MKTLLKYLISLGFEQVKDYGLFILWLKQPRNGYINDISIKKDSRGYLVETAVILNNAIKESRYTVKTISEVKEIISQDLI